MKRRALLICSFLTAWGSAASGATPVGDCEWVSGRLSAYNGAPTFRIWPQGTRRLLGVVSRSGSPERSEVLPANILAANPSFERALWGEFRVCPMTNERRGWMQMVVLTDGRWLRAATPKP